MKLIHDRTSSEGIAGVETVIQLVGHVHFASVLDSADAITGSRKLETAGALAKPAISELLWTDWIETRASLEEVQKQSCSGGPVSCTRIDCRRKRW